MSDIDETDVEVRQIMSVNRDETSSGSRVEASARNSCAREEGDTGDVGAAPVSDHENETTIGNYHINRVEMFAKGVAFEVWALLL